MFIAGGKIILTLIMAECIIGMLGNVFISLVNFSESVQNRKISLADLILTCLAISRIGNLFMLLLQSCIKELHPHLYSTFEVKKLVHILWRMTNHLTIWFATCLSIFYFLKIAHFSHSLFLWLKWRMDRVVLGLVLFSLFLVIFDFLWIDKFIGILLTIYITDKGNKTLNSEERSSFHVKILSLGNLTYFIPFVLSLTSLLLLFLSLVRHARNLRLNAKGFGDASTQTHKRAMKMVLSFLLLFTIHSFSIQLMYWTSFTFWKNKLINFLVLVLNIFPSGHTFLLILGNVKLRQAALRLLCHLKRCLML
nr:taste receptor type 2 member 42 [Oryctolagus cuniculus]